MCWVDTKKYFSKLKCCCSSRKCKNVWKRILKKTIFYCMRSNLLENNHESAWNISYVEISCTTKVVYVCERLDRYFFPSSSSFISRKYLLMISKILEIEKKWKVYTVIIDGNIMFLARYSKSIDVLAYYCSRLCRPTYSSMHVHKDELIFSMLFFIGFHSKTCHLSLFCSKKRWCICMFDFTRFCDLTNFTCLDFDFRKATYSYSNFIFFILFQVSHCDLMNLCWSWWMGTISGKCQGLLSEHVIGLSSINPSRIFFSHLRYSYFYCSYFPSQIKLTFVNTETVYHKWKKLWIMTFE